MPIYVFDIGVPTAISQNVVWALPHRACRIVAIPNCELSQSSDGPWVAMTGPTEGFESGASFIRCTTGFATITCKV